MKKFFVAFLAVLALIGVSSAVLCAEEKADGKAIVYYFHGTFRCMTCMNMEKYSREAIETNFKDALQSGKLEFNVLNVEEKGNEHFVKDYQLYTKSLVLSFVKDGKEVKSKNLDKIWEYAHNKQEFVQYVADEVRAFMKDAS
ncbi:MAG: nitrophenyl compound nitroreductase subunit ArsF family protein [Candidatus Velamenicoccus archaeovorus]